MRTELIAAVSAMLLLLTVQLPDTFSKAPHWSDAEVENHFRDTLRRMGTDTAHWKVIPTRERDRLVILGTHRKASARAEYGTDGRLLRWDCTRCPPLAGSPATEETVRPLLGSKSRMKISDGVVISASSEPPRADPPGRGLASALHGTSTALFWIFLSVTFGAGVRTILRLTIPRVAIAITVFCWVSFLVILLVTWFNVPNTAYRLFDQPVLWLLPCIAGLRKLQSGTVGKWIGFLHAAELWRPAQRTGIEAWHGLLLAWPLALAARLAGPVADLETTKPVLQDTALYFAFIVPLLAGSRYLRNPKWRLGFQIAIGLLLFAGIYPVRSGYPLLDLLSGLILFGLCCWIYLTHGLMGVFAAAWASTLTAVPLAAGIGLYGGALSAAGWLRSRGTLAQDEDLAVEVLRRNAPQSEMELRSEREVLLTEFAEAREAQMGMLPASAPSIPGYSLAAVCIPAREVGGDLYDIIPFPGGQWGFCVADVSGKGVPAALYMTMTKGVLASEQRVTSDLRALSLALNERLHEAAQKKVFVTMALARLDPATRCVELIRAGHNAVLWRRAGLGETVWLKPAGLGLGLVANKAFQRSLATQSVQLEPGDTLILYSDGLTEAENTRVELFGEERLQQVLEVSHASTAEDLVQEILAEVERFKEGADPHDDLTLLVLKVSA